MTKTKKIVSIALAVVMLVSALALTTLFASAEDYTLLTEQNYTGTADGGWSAEMTEFPADISAYDSLEIVYSDNSTRTNSNNTLFKVQGGTAVEKWGDVAPVDHGVITFDKAELGTNTTLCVFPKASGTGDYNVTIHSATFKVAGGDDVTTTTVADDATTTTVADDATTTTVADDATTTTVADDATTTTVADDATTTTEATTTVAGPSTTAKNPVAAGEIEATATADVTKVKPGEKVKVTAVVNGATWNTRINCIIPLVLGYDNTKFTIKKAGPNPSFTVGDAVAKAKAAMPNYVDPDDGTVTPAAETITKDPAVDAIFAPIGNQFVSMSYDFGESWGGPVCIANDVTLMTFEFTVKTDCPDGIYNFTISDGTIASLTPEPFSFEEKGVKPNVVYNNLYVEVSSQDETTTTEAAPATTTQAAPATTTQAAPATTTQAAPATTTTVAGQTTTVAEGETTTVAEGETTTVAEGETTTVAEGETTTVAEGETTTTISTPSEVQELYEEMLANPDDIQAIADFLAAYDALETDEERQAFLDENGLTETEIEVLRAIVDAYNETTTTTTTTVAGGGNATTTTAGSNPKTGAAAPIAVLALAAIAGGVVIKSRKK